MWMFIGLALVLLGLAEWNMKGAFNYWKKKGVPNPAPTPIFGNIGPSLLMKEHLGVIYKNMYRNFKECSYIGFYKMLTPCVLLIDLNLIKEVLIKEFSSFHDNIVDVDLASEPLFGRNPFFLKGNKWKIVRTQVTTTMTSGKIKHMFLSMAKTSKDLVTHLNNKVGNKNGVNAKDLSTKFTIDVVASCAFGLDGNALSDPDSEFYIKGKKMFEPNFKQSLLMMIVFLFPSITKIFKLSLAPKVLTDWFTDTLKQTIKYREENQIVRNDFLDLMLALKSKPGEYVFEDIDVMAQAMTFFTDGTETSATTLNLTLYEIAKNPKIQEKLRQEIDAVLAKCNGEITYEGMQEMEYLDMVLSESLRLHPPATFLMKSCTKKFTLPPVRGEGTGPSLVIEPGMPIAIPVYAIHHDDRFYPDPQKFDPERFTDEAKKERPKCSYIPFGEGPRMCLGFRFAVTQVKIGLITIVSNFEIKLNSKTTPGMEVDPKGFVLAKKGGVWLDFSKRSK